MLPTLDEILAHENTVRPRAARVARSREDRPVDAFQFGSGERKISLVGGCHADEPVGPTLLDHLIRCLSTLPHDSETLSQFQWWIVPHINPDGAQRNRAWYEGVADRYDPVAYLTHVVRELPGDDIEFGFPCGSDDAGARPEPRGVYAWWRSDARPFALHVSLHGMAFAGGPWFLIDGAWADRSSIVRERCRTATKTLGYALHDVQRNGEKGFTRISRGFCTRPDSGSMARYFRERNDEATAALFRPSSMETIRSLGGDALTMVTEMPLFVTPGVGEQIEPSDPIAEGWRERIALWKQHLADPAARDGVRDAIERSGVTAMPIYDQMYLQWTAIRAGIEQLLSTDGAS